MKLFFSLLLFIGSNSYAAPCSLEEAKSALRTSLEKKVNDGRYDGIVDSCIRDPREIENVVMNLVKNKSEVWGGDYQVVVCEAFDRQYGTHSVVYANVDCKGPVVHFDRFDRD